MVDENGWVDWSTRSEANEHTRSTNLYPAMIHTLKLITLNINGIDSENRLRILNDFLHKHDIDITTTGGHTRKLA
jgi:hypothetical protein